MNTDVTLVPRNFTSLQFYSTESLSLSLSLSSLSLFVSLSLRLTYGVHYLAPWEDMTLEARPGPREEGRSRPMERSVMDSISLKHRDRLPFVTHRAGSRVLSTTTLQLCDDG